MMKKEFIDASLGNRAADILIRNGRLVNVYSGEIIEKSHIVVKDRYIVYVGPSDTHPVDDATTVVDAKGSYILPGYIDAHAHADFWANPISITPYLLQSGTTALFTDTHDFVGAVGLHGLDFLIDITRNLPVKFYFALPVCSPPFPEIEGGDLISDSDVAHYLQYEKILGLSEVTPWLRLIAGDENLLTKFEQSRRKGKSVEGHTTGASYDKLNALAVAGLTSCHEAITAEEARNRLRLGYMVMLRHGSIRSDLEPLITLVTRDPKPNTHRILLTPDWKSPEDILSDGYMDHLVRLAIEHSVDPVTAVQMATLNPATYLHLDREIGGIAPGRIADIQLVEALDHPTPHTVVADGTLVIRENRLTYEPPQLPPEAYHIPWLDHRVIPDHIHPADFGFKQVDIPGIGIVDKTITRRIDVTLVSDNGNILLPPGGDILKLAVRNKDNTGFITVPIVGFGATFGALASSMAHERHKPLVVGYNDADMAYALNRLKTIGGGLVLVDNGNVLAEMPFDIGGMMSSAPLPKVAGQAKRIKKKLKEMGCLLEDPIFTLGFLSFSALPWIRITPGGLYDVKHRKIIYS